MLTLPDTASVVDASVASAPEIVARGLIEPGDVRGLFDMYVGLPYFVVLHANTHFFVFLLLPALIRVLSIDHSDRRVGFAFCGVGRCACRDGFPGLIMFFQQLRQPQSDFIIRSNAGFALSATSALSTYVDASARTVGDQSDSYL